MSERTSSKEKKVGLVLGGGGLRGLAHIGVLKALEGAGVEVDLLAGTSMGGVIGAMYAAGMSVEQIEKEMLSHTNTAGMRRLIDIRLSYRGLVRGNRIYNMIADTIGAQITFADLDLPLSVVAVDGVSGCEVLLDSGKVVDAVRATISVPGIFEPVEKEGMVLIDGGILNNVPTDVARNMGAKVVIAVDVMPDFSRNTPGQPLVEPAIDPDSLPSFLREALHVEYIMISALTSAKLREFPPDILIRPQISPEVDLLIGFEHAEEVIAAGEAATLAAAFDILDLL